MNGGQGEEGFLSMAEVSIGTLVIALLLVSAVITLRVTEKGTINQKKQEDALSLAKAKVEEIKENLASETWGNMLIDQRFPPVTPAATPYDSYPPTTITMGNNQYIVKPEVRYVYNDNNNLIQYVPTPGTAATPEGGGTALDMIRVRADAYYGPLNNWVPLPTAEAVSNVSNRVIYSNILTNRNFNASGPSQINGQVQVACSSSSGVNGALVGLYQGSLQVMTSITSGGGYFNFQNVPEGTYAVSLVSAPGYDPAGSCSPSNMVTAGGSSYTVNLAAIAISTWNYFGVVVKTTPGITPPPTINPTLAPTYPPTPFVATIVPTGTPGVPNAIVFANDGNSMPVTADGNGNFVIPNVRSVPVAGHYYDTIEGDDLTYSSPTSIGQNFNYGVHAGSVSYSGGQTYIGPITLYVDTGGSGTESVSFQVLDYDTNAKIPNTPPKLNPITLTVNDGSAVPPVATLTSGVTACSLNVRDGEPNASVALAGNTGPPSYTCFSGPISVSPSTAGTPVVLYNYAVGAVTGTIAGMGASFNYAQFQVTAQDVNNQFNYTIPVSYDGASTYGTWYSNSIRTPLSGPNDPYNYGGTPQYTFTVNTAGNYTSTQELQTLSWGNTTSIPVLIISPLNVYMAVTVTQHNTAYPDGAWVSAQQWSGGAAPGSLPATQGSGFTGNAYFSTVTHGDGTGLFAVQLSNGAATSFTVTAQIVDPNSYAVTSKSVTLSMPTTATYSNPKGVSFAF